MGGSFWFALRAAAVVAGIVALAWQPPPGWVETAYANGAYPGWERAAFGVTSRAAWSLGDLAFGIGIVAILFRIAAFVRAGGRRRASVLAAALLDIGAIGGLYAVWFEASWGWNYARAPVEARLRYDAARVTPEAAVRLRTEAIREVNGLAAAAHAHAAQALDLDGLRGAWLPAVRRAGDDWVPLVGEPKPTIANPFMEATGTSGFINPLTLNVQLAGDVLWFERPFDLAHEWSHDAAYAREDEANYLAIVSCLRSPDPAIRYSGWLELFLYLPQKRHYARREFGPLVWQDFEALRLRNSRHVNVLLAHWTWRTYNAYLKTNRVAGGVENYNEVTRLMLGIPLDRAGLPEARGT